MENRIGDGYFNRQPRTLRKDERGKKKEKRDEANLRPRRLKVRELSITAKALPDHAR